jgi:hypothetical protein
VKAEKPDEADVDLQATDAMISAALPLIDTLFNGAAHGKDRKIGYVLLTFPMNRPDLPLNEGKCNFGSNGANREDLAKMFRFMLKEWEKAGKIEPQPEEG